MLRRSSKKNNKAQIFLEYSIICSVVLVVLITMNMLIKRGIQGMIKVTADQIGEQENSDQTFDEGGHMERQYISVRAMTDKTTREFLGVTNYIYNDAIRTDIRTETNLGFTNED